MEILDKYIIEYTNNFKVNGQTFAFRKKENLNRVFNLKTNK